MREQRDHFDEMLDGALASYGQASAREGLEQRVLASVANSEIRTPRIAFLEIAAICVAVAAVFCLFWWQMPHARQKHSPQEGLPASQEVVVTKAQTVRPRNLGVFAASRTKPARKPKRVAEPKLRQFPTPFPLNNEERALLRLARRNGNDIPRELTGLGSPIEPIQIAAIEIKPLE